VSYSFRILSRSRSSSQGGPNPISLSDINAHINLYGPPLLPVDVFVDLLYQIDVVYLKIVGEQIKRSLKGSGRKS
jgi:hypothetical protein